MLSQFFPNSPGPGFWGCSASSAAIYRSPPGILPSSPDQTAPLVRICTGVLVVALVELVTPSKVHVLRDY